MKAIRNYFFDEEEWQELGSSYKRLGIIFLISAITTIIIELA